MFIFYIPLILLIYYSTIASICVSRNVYIRMFHLTLGLGFPSKLGRIMMHQLNVSILFIDVSTKFFRSLNIYG